MLKKLILCLTFVSVVVQVGFAADSSLVRVALFKDKGVAGQGVPRLKLLLSDTNEFSVTLVKGSDVVEGVLTNFDVVIFSGGSGGAQAAALGEEGREQVRQFVSRGGGYVGICAGAYLACSGFDWGVGVLNAKTISSKWARGEGNVEVEFIPKVQKLTGFSSAKKEVKYANGPVIKPDDKKGIPPYETVAFFRTELAKNGSPKGIMVDSPAMVRGTYGKGRVLFSSPHPEQTEGLESLIPLSIRWVSGKETSSRE